MRLGCRSRVEGPPGDFLHTSAEQGGSLTSLRVSVPYDAVAAVTRPPAAVSRRDLLTSRSATRGTPNVAAQGHAHPA